MAGPVNIYRPKLACADDPECLGYWMPEQRRINIRRDLKGRIAWQVLLHELAHVVLFDTGLNTGDEAEERVVDPMASGMMHVVTYLLNEAQSNGPQAAPSGPPVTRVALPDSGT